jgi:DNA polymerase III delta subunit
MITVLTGENTFEVQQALDVLIRSFNGAPERIDGSDLDLRQLPDLLMGGTLFASERLVVIKGLADNTSLWAEFGDWLGRISDDVHVVLVEAKLDKRTKTYKSLKEKADLREFPLWKDGDMRTAETWVTSEVQARQMKLDGVAIRTLVAWVGIDQWQLHFALEKLAVLDTVTPEVIRNVIETTPADSVFQVFEAALRGDRVTLHRLMTTLQHTEDGFRLFGLLSGQVFQLAALAVTDQPASEVARALGVHPYALGKLQPHADRLGRAGARRVVRRLADADHRLKTGSDDVWTVLEAALTGIA